MGTNKKKIWEGWLLHDCMMGHWSMVDHYYMMGFFKGPTLNKVVIGKLETIN